MNYLLGYRELWGAYSYLCLNWMKDYASFYIPNSQINFRKLEENYSIDYFDEEVKNHYGEKTNILISTKNYLERTTFKKLKEVIEKDDIGIIISEIGVASEDWVLLNKNREIKPEEKFYKYEEDFMEDPQTISLYEVIVLDPDSLLKKLRNRFLHFSAHYTTIADCFANAPAQNRIRPEY